MLCFTVIFSYSINLLRTSGWQCGILRVGRQRVAALPSPLPCWTVQRGCRTALATRSVLLREGPAPQQDQCHHLASFSYIPCAPLTSGSAGSSMQSPFHTPMHGPVVLCREPRKHQSKAAARRWLCDPASPTPTRPGTRGQLQVSITWRKQPASSVCITCWRRKTTESARGQKQQPGEEEFIKRKGKGSKACLYKGRASSKPSCDPQPRRVRAGALPTQPPPRWLSPRPGCPSERHLGTLLPHPSKARGLRQRVLTKLDAFTPPRQHHFLLPLGCSGSSAPGVGGWFFGA